jgi:hypothetical protein
MEMTNPSEWNGSLFIWPKRVLFVGEAGTSENQTVHAIKICVALGSDSELRIESGAIVKRFSAVIINAGIKHTVICNQAEIFLLYLLPESDEAIKLRQEYLNNGRSGVYDVPRELIEQSLPLQTMRRKHLERDCKKASKVCDEVIRGLGTIRRKPLSTSSDLSDTLHGDVKRVIGQIYDDIYFETDIRRRSQRIKKEQFEPSAIGRKLGWKAKQTRRVEAIFRKEVGISIKRFFREIQLLSALRQYAIQEMEGTMYKETHLKEIAGLLDCSLSLLDKRISSRLGINLSDLKGGGSFFACQEKATKT